ncbi:hypothetical protein [Lysobacter enzymogenes]|uniref:hypothetical protein n=1 Tax=Lysobacter enzymogenes TaxID=69 RepID=UPI00099DBD07|nr:hypothetical protein [Lysobacter enzymogenes]UZW61936.1 hypothetical protein BV903_006445 [Lysobacter enzymogenes]
MKHQIATVALALILGMATIWPAQAQEICLPELNPQDSAQSCGGDPGGGGGGGGTPGYVLQGVIQNEGYTTEGAVPGGKRLKIRAYSRLADASNDRVDAHYINVRCNAYDPYGPGYTSDYDEENNGALVDVKFASNSVQGEFRTVKVVCTHHARFGFLTYDTTSSAEIVVPH